MFRLPFVASVLLLSAPAPGLPSRLTAADLDFNRDVRPILFANCVACHGPDEKERKADLRLDTRDGATAGGTVVPGKPDEGEFLRRVTAADPDELMPPAKTGKKLTPQQVAVIREWVRQGANYSVHWAYAKPVRPPLPAVSDPSWPKTDLDHFILTRLDREGLKPSPEADRLTLARRVALDLTGLPPTIAEADEFALDNSPGAYERYVDRQLAKPAYGEHWARMWLDLARYADSAGYADDPPRTIWPYRDYVIRSFNANKPFDRFTVEQIAGDLLPDPAEEQLVATAFHRNTMTNSEGGTNDEEFRTVAVVDRVNTTMAVWMGTSLACAQCHTHKYDPITQAEYFRLFAFLNNTADADRPDESPVLPVGDTASNKTKRAEIEAAAGKLERLARFQSALVQGGLKVQAAKLRKEADRYKPQTTVPVMKELPADGRRVTKLQHRGNFLDTGAVLTEGVPEAFHPLPRDARPDRLALARWLVSADNPLTARVTANRLWEQVFGTGLVRTSEEFGTQGELPSHPELLDFLATELVRDGWDVKRFLKILVTSAAYRQSSRVTPSHLERDPDNRFLARGPRFRLPAEAVRDQALAASGLLSPKMYGPPVKPPQPTFGLSAAFGKTLDWKTSDGEDRHRRGLYTEWRRSNPYPSMATFDAPSRETCTVRRTRTNTPLQALVLLNDPVYLEAAQALARVMAATAGQTTEKVAAGFRRCLTRPPTEKETARLVMLYVDARAEYRKDPAKAAKLVVQAAKEADPADLAAWTVVANVLLNLDEMVFKP